MGSNMQTQAQTRLATTPQLVKANMQAQLGNVLKNLKPGQMLEARLVSVNGDGAAQLKLANGTMLKSALPQKMPLGSRLQLRMESNGRNNAPTLKLVSHQPPQSGPSQPGKTPMAQQPKGAGRSIPLPPAPADNPGAQTQQVGADRSVLSCALRAFAEAGKNLGHLGNISNAHGQQNGDGGQNELSLRLPLMFQGERQYAQIHVGREPSATEGPERDGWRIRFKIEFAALGAIEARMRLQNDRLDVSLWAQEAQTAAEMRDMLHELRAGLASRNIQAGSLLVHNGRPGASLGADGEGIGA